jgi:hypothetical protein
MFRNYRVRDRAPGIAIPCCQRTNRAREHTGSISGKIPQQPRDLARARFACKKLLLDFSSLGELRVLFGLLLLRLAARSRP